MRGFILKIWAFNSGSVVVKKTKNKNKTTVFSFQETKSGKRKIGIGIVPWIPPSKYICIELVLQLYHSILNFVNKNCEKQNNYVSTVS